jgi:hypothetical protein
MPLGERETEGVGSLFSARCSTMAISSSAKKTPDPFAGDFLSC